MHFPLQQHLMKRYGVVFCQVVLRNGVPIDAKVPDYAELDTVPNERRYTADQTSLESQPPADPPSNPPCSPSSVKMVDTAAFSSQVAADAGGEAEAALEGKVSLVHMSEALPFQSVSNPRFPSPPPPCAPRPPISPNLWDLQCGDLMSVTMSVQT